MIVSVNPTPPGMGVPVVRSFSSVSTFFSRISTGSMPNASASLSI